MRQSIKTNNNTIQSKVFDISILERKAFELSRLNDFVDGHDDIFDVLHSDQNQQHHR